MDERTILAMLTPLQDALQKIEEDRRHVLAAYTEIEALAKAHGIPIVASMVTRESTVATPYLPTGVNASGAISTKDAIKEVLREAAGQPMSADLIWMHARAKGAESRPPLQSRS